MNRSELNKILEEHKKWLMTAGEEGKRADLRHADLSSANLNSANLSSANLNSANLSSANLSSADLSYADLSSANLSSANLSSADLSYADLSSANLSYADLYSADLRHADLSSANLSSANLDYSAFPLLCGGLNVHIDDKQAIQLLYHLNRLCKLLEENIDEKSSRWGIRNHSQISNDIVRLRRKLNTLNKLMHPYD